MRSWRSESTADPWRYWADVPVRSLGSSRNSSISVAGSQNDRGSGVICTCPERKSPYPMTDSDTAESPSFQFAAAQVFRGSGRMSRASRRPTQNWTRRCRPGRITCPSTGLPVSRPMALPASGRTRPAPEYWKARVDRPESAAQRSKACPEPALEKLAEWLGRTREAGRPAVSRPSPHSKGIHSRSVAPRLRPRHERRIRTTGLVLQTEGVPEGKECPSASRRHH